MFEESYGAQFRERGAAGLFLLFVALVVFSISLMIKGPIISGIVLFLFSILLLIYVINIKGIQIDMEKGLYRVYSFTIRGKLGNWQSYSGYKTITVKYDSFNVKTVTFNTDSSSTINESHGRFLVELEHLNNTTKTLFIREEHKYYNALNYAQNLSKKLDLPVKDYFGDKLTAKRR